MELGRPGPELGTLLLGSSRRPRSACDRPHVRNRRLEWAPDGRRSRSSDHFRRESLRRRLICGRDPAIRNVLLYQHCAALDIFRSAGLRSPSTAGFVSCGVALLPLLFNNLVVGLAAGERRTKQ
jgi:hypothetical protein